MARLADPFLNKAVDYKYLYSYQPGTCTTDTHVQVVLVELLHHDFSLLLANNRKNKQCNGLIQGFQVLPIGIINISV
jgi:hypothetical protein